MDMTARREAINLVIVALMLAAAAMIVSEAQEHAQNTPAVSVGEHHDVAIAETVQPGNLWPSS